MAAVTAAISTGTSRRGGAAARWGPWIRAAVGGGILVAIIAAAGAEPFVRGFAAVSPAAIGAAALLAAAATAAASWRWRILAGRMGLRLGWAESVAAYYRSQFLNTVLPGGVVGDVHRAVAHGRSVDHVAQAARAVAAERAAGQAVQLVLAVGVLASIGFSAYSPAMTVLLVSAVLAVAALALAATNRRARSALGREWAILRGPSRPLRRCSGSWPRPLSSWSRTSRLFWWPASPWASMLPPSAWEPRPSWRCWRRRFP
nr:hypothetical protein GCM10025699_11280 [Microbacterium flavescens]